MLEKITYAVEHKDKNFGNARYIRNLFEKVLEHQSTRLMDDEDLTKSELQEITTEDIAALT